jgi:TonB family protein
LRGLSASRIRDLPYRSVKVRCARADVFLVVARSAGLSRLFLVSTVLFGCASASATGPGLGQAAAPARRVSGYSVHEATDSDENDGRLQMQQDHGFISQEAAQEAVMRRWAELRSCYREAGAATAFAGGPVTLRFVVAATGAISDVQVAETRLGNFEVERCLLAASRTVAFPRPRGGAPASVDYTLEFQSTGDVAVIDFPDDAVDAKLPGLLGQQLGARCQTLGGDEVFATVYVDAAGTVRSAGLASPASLDGEAASCLARALRKARIPVPAVHGRSLGRLKIALRAADLLARTEPPPAHTRSGRRPPRR